MVHRISAVALPLLLCTLAYSGCSDEDSVSGDELCCSTTATATFLKSKSDDDDGDGNIHDEDFPQIDDEDDAIADHAWVRDALGVYHLFFHNEGLFSASQIEHYTSRNFQDLTYVGVALSPNPNGWDSHALWAPHVIKSGDTYFMFYTGVNGQGANAKQRIGVATSTDLIVWTRYPINKCSDANGDGCIYECTESWTAWGDTQSDHSDQCRDPFVVWDGDNERWVMFATARHTNQFATVTVAYSTDLKSWDGAGPIDATRRLATGADAQTTGGEAENPHVVTYRNTNYLLFTDWRDPEDSLSVAAPRTIVQYATAPSLVADTLGSANWVYRGSTPDPGVNAIEVQRAGDIWLMSQSIANPRSGDKAHRRELRLKCILWQDNFTFDTSNAKFSQGATIRAVGPLAPGAADTPTGSRAPLPEE